MASQVGVGEVAIVPTLRGFRKRVTSEVDGSAKDAARGFQKGMSKAGDDSGAAAGRGFKNRFNREASGAGAAASKELTASVAKASREVAGSRLREQDAAGKVRVAEAQLAEARSKYAADSSQVVRAEERLASATRALGAQQATTAAASDRLAQAQANLAQATSAAERATRSGGWGAFRKNVSDLFAPVTSLAGAVGGLASRAFAPAARAVAGWGSTMVRTVSGAVRPAVTAVRDFASNVGSRVSSAVSTAGQAVSRVLAPALSRLSPVTAAMGRSFQGAVGIARQALGSLGPVVSAAGAGISRAWSSAMAGVKRVAGDAAQFAQSAFKTASVAVAATLGVALAKGFSRLESIDTARTKLSALGNTAENVETLMNSALDSVRGTAFGLGDAAGAAGALAAAKVPMGLVDRALKSISSTAAVAGADMGEMGDIFAKVAAQQKLGGETVNQLLSRQVPILQMIQDHYGVTGAEAKKMVTAGKISFEDFVAITGSLGDAAKIMGTSFRGMLSNVGAALGRFGAVALAPFFEGLKALMPGLMAVIDQVTDAVKPMFEAIGARVVPMMERLGEALSKLKFDGSGLSNLSGVLAVLAPVIGLIVGSLGSALTGLSVFGLNIGGIFAGLTGPLGLVAGGLVALLAVDPLTLLGGFQSFADAIPSVMFQVIGAVVNALSTIVPALVERLAVSLPVLVNGLLSLIPAIIDGVSQLVAIVANMLPTLLPQLVAGAMTLFSGLVTGLSSAIPQILSAISTAIPMIINALVTALPMLIQGALQLFMGLLQALVKIIPQLIRTIIELLPVILQALLTMLPALIEGAIQLFLGLVLGLVEMIPELVQALVDLVPVLIDALVSMLPQLITGAIELFLGLITGLMQALPQLLSAVIAAVPKIVTSLVSMLPKLVQGAIQLFTGILTGLTENLPKILRFIVTDLIPSIVKAIIDAVPQLLDAGVALIQGLIDGVMSMFGAVGDAVGGLMDWIGGFFPRSPAKRGPFSGSGWTRLKRSGGAIIEQFTAGFNLPDLSGALSLVVPAVSARSAAAVSRTVQATVSGDTNNFYGVTTDTAASEIGSVIEKKKRRRIRKTGALAAAGVS